MIKEFRDFIMRGNVLDLAVAVMIGAAFGAIVTSFVNDILMPPIGLLLGGVDFSNRFIDLSGGDYESLAAAQEAGAATLNYGLFLNHVINFIIVHSPSSWWFGRSGGSRNAPSGRKKPCRPRRSRRPKRGC